MVERGANGRIRVLHLILTVGETNSQYSEHCLPMIGKRDLSICTYFPLQLTPPSEITVFAGDGTLRGFVRVLRAALRAKVYDVVHVHAPQTGLLLVLHALLWGQLPRLRRSTVYTVHDSFYDYKLRNQILLVLLLPVYKRVMFCSQAAYDSLPGVWKRLVKNRWRVVQNGFDLERVDRVLAVHPIARPEDRFDVISVGRLEQVKDPLTLLRAFAAAAELSNRLVFVGVGALELELNEAIGKLRIERAVQLTGLIPRDDVFVRCAASSLFVSTSLGEGLPVAVMEAMATGAPAVLSDIAPHRELVDGVDFIPLVAPGDIEGFASEIKRFREMSTEERAEIGRRCRDHVATRFSLANMHAGTEAVYREVAAL